MWTYLLIVPGCFLFLRLRRGRYQERAAAKMLTSPLYRTASGLSVLLIGVTLYMASLKDHVSVGWFVVVGVMVIAILAMRRALQWRYPYR
jgi:uncharacterized membrane protein YdfJ with MMPL/SSD domain